MTENLLQQGLELAVFGMGTVFVFLVMLIFATRGMSHLALKYGASTAAESASDSTPTAAASEADQSELIAVIAAAIHQFRSSTNK